jgi:hypothetical protein
MRGPQERTGPLFSYVSTEDRIPQALPLRQVRRLADQAIYGIRSERMLIEQLDYNLLFRWFVGLDPDGPVWHPTTYTLTSAAGRSCRRH